MTARAFYFCFLGFAGVFIMLGCGGGEEAASPEWAPCEEQEHSCVWGPNWKNDWAPCECHEHADPEGCMYVSYNDDDGNCRSEAANSGLTLEDCGWDGPTRETCPEPA